MLLKNNLGKVNQLILRGYSSIVLLERYKSEI